MKKILFTDLDGTLLRDDKTISEKNRLAIKQMLDAGHYVVVTTGRPVKSGLEVVKQLGLTIPGCYMIAFNGAVVYDCETDSVLIEKTMNIGDVEYLFQEADKYGLHVQTYTKGYLLAQKERAELEYYVKMTGMPYRIAENVLDALDTEPNKVLLCSLDEKNKLIQFQNEHKEWEKERCKSFFSCAEYLEYCPKDVDKGSGIRFLTDFLKVDPKNTYGVGDEQNDIPMLREAGVGIAVKNAGEEVKQAANYITENSNNEDAIAEIIEKILDETFRV